MYASITSLAGTYAGGFPRFLETPLGGQYLIINIMGGIHTCRTVWAQLVNHTIISNYSQHLTSTTNQNNGKSVSRVLCLQTPCCFASTLLETPNKIFCLRPWLVCFEYYKHLNINWCESSKTTERPAVHAISGLHSKNLLL